MRTINGMSAASSLPVAAVPSIRRLQLITVVWMSVEVLVSVIAALRAHSVALLAFGGDSLIELASALVVFSRFSGARVSERAAAKSTAVLLFLLAAFIIAASSFSLSGLLLTPQPSYLGIGLLLAAAAIMPWLARQKRQLAQETGSSAMAADAVQSSVCAWLAWIALAGVGANSLFRISCGDTETAL